MKQLESRAAAPASVTGPSDAFAPWLTAAIALAYVAWLGWHWLPLDYSAQELAAGVSRVWDIKQELLEHHRLTWWTPYYMSGSGYGLNHAQGFWIVPWVGFSMFTDPATAGKVMALLALFASALSMYFCALHFLQHRWAAVLAALAYLLHPHFLESAGGMEHVGLILAVPFLPLLWWLFARALERGTLRDTLACALAASALTWTANKEAVVMSVFLFCYALFWVSWQPPRAGPQFAPVVRTCLRIAVVTLALSLFFILPGLVESNHVTLFRGDPLEGWRYTYSFKSLLGIVDRDQVLAHAAANGVTSWLQQNGGRVASPEQATLLRRVLALEVDNKYAGLLVLGIIAVTASFNRQRQNRGVFWFLIAMLLLGVMLATGETTVWHANAETWKALLTADGVPTTARMTAMTVLVAFVVLLVIFARRKLTTYPKWLWAGVTLAAFLFVPAFRLVALLPLYRDVRAPFVFYDYPFAFFSSLLTGFLVTDVLAANAKLRAAIPQLVVGLMVLLLWDSWFAQAPMKDNGVPVRTLRNLRATYRALHNDPDWVKTYAITGRYFHLLGPMYSGKPQVSEAWVNWMSPLGTGLLKQHAWDSVATHRAFLNLMGARYIVFDKSDPNNLTPNAQQTYNVYRQTFPVHMENEDFVVFRNDSARPYVSATTGVCLYVGDVSQSAPLALDLADKDFTLVQATEVDLQDIPAVRLQRFAKVYKGDSPAVVPGMASARLPLGDIQLVRASNELIRISLSAPGDCVVVISESYYPFWYATVDGKPATVLRVDCGLMGVELTGGTHEIILHYQSPRAYAAAGALSLLTLASCVGGLMFLTR